MVTVCGGELEETSSRLEKGQEKARMTLPENLYMDPSVQDRHRCTQVGYSSGNWYWILTFLGMLGGRMKFFISYNNLYSLPG